MEFKTLMEKVIAKSESNNWEDAVNEWEIIDCEEDKHCFLTCICGKENINYIFTIQNKINNNILFPIEKTCIERFECGDLIEKISIYEQLFKLFHKVRNNEFIKLESDLFSCKLLRYLHKDGAFDNAYNDYDGFDDYQFILKMFNMEDKSKITEKQSYKIKAIIVNSILPYLMRKSVDKIRE